MFSFMMAIDIVIPLDQIQRRAWVKYQLELHGYTFGKLARELGVSRGVPQQALSHPYPKMERAIAEKIGVPPQVIWPERYDAQGLPNRPMGRPRAVNVSSHVKRNKHITIERSGNVKDREAA